MFYVPIPENEEARLANLHTYELLDTAPEPAFDRLAELAASICGTPIALISLVDRERQWFKSRVGLTVSETPRDVSFCAHAILGSGPLVVPDASADERFSTNKLVTGDPHIRFYAGVPLTTAEGFAVGTLCVIDNRPRNLTEQQARDLSALSEIVLDKLRLRRYTALQNETIATQKLIEEELERRVLSRTTELRLLNEHLKHAKQAAEIASQAKTDFLANMSHELRTPMNGILGISDLLVHSSEIPSEERAMLQVVQQSAKALMAVIGDVLDLACLDAGNVALNLQEFSPRSLIEGTVESFRAAILAKDLSLHVDICPEVPAVRMGDANRLRQIVSNLIGNAVKFTHRGGITIAVACDVLDQKRPQLHFSVTDSGVGIEPDKQRTIFERFTQADTSTTRRYGGIGLGLTIAAQLVKLMGGRIWVCSNPGKGSSFHFTLPESPE